MNSFHKSTQQSLCLLLVMVLNNSLYALTFRNEPLTHFIEHGQALCATVGINTIIMLEIESDNFDIKEDDVQSLNNLAEVFKTIKESNSGPSLSARSLNMSSNVLSYNCSYLGGLEHINLKARTSSNFNRCLFESPLISIAGSEMNFCDCFLIDPKILNIIIDHPGSGYDIIELEFHEQSENPTIVTGNIDLKNNETKKQLIISNVKEIRMHFVWHKNVLQNVEPVNNSKAPGFFAKSHQEIVSFYNKYITPYL